MSKISFEKHQNEPPTREIDVIYNKEGMDTTKVSQKQLGQRKKRVLESDPNQTRL
jgi:hypothetical protein